MPSHRPHSVAPPTSSLAGSPVTERPRAKRLGGKVLATSYPAARATVAHIFLRAMRDHAMSEDRVAQAMGTSRSLIHAYCDPSSPNKPRLDLMVCVAVHGGQAGRNLVVQALREVLALVEDAKPLNG